ncbi:hypothetical protein FSARC_12873 [Fusarium sarcochroum]|uniref:Uncharacterized protein n=1 Tax=Fusarium sarcochroum TaxID=1208366 RepID=A0A8H4T5E7_9HYPO|nr:hypothetical protein FSARC_12873 [Fusarium sarcochroum]
MGQGLMSYATAKDILGNWTMGDHDLWPSSVWTNGKFIDAAGFKDSKDSRPHVIRKQKGDTSGPNGVNALFLQEVGQDGITMVGKAVLLVNRIESVEGKSLEAPNLVRMKNDMYVLFQEDDTYDIKYAYSTNTAYTRAPRSLFKTPMFSLRAPGGAISNEAGDKLLFHG